MHRLDVMVATVAVVLALIAPGVILAAYGAGRRAGRKLTVPWRPIFQLVDHRLRCRGLDAARVREEISAGVALPSWAWDELLAMRPPLGERTLRRSVRERMG